MDCPFDCPYLQEARQRERVSPADPETFPNRDIKISEQFLRDNEMLLLFLGKTLMQAGLNTPGAIDYDLRDALDALVRTYRTRQSGLYYDTRPGNLLAARIVDSVQSELGEFAKTEQEKFGMTKTRDADVLGMLAFLQRLELDRNNGRRRGRAFLDFLRAHFADSEQRPMPVSSSLVIP